MTEENGEVVFSSGNAAVAVRRATFAVRLLVDRHEVSALSRWGMQLQDTEITTPHHTAVGGDGLHLVEQETEKRPGFRFRLSFDFAKEEQIYGLGQHASGTLNRRMTATHLYQNNNTAPVPFFVSSRGYGVFINTEAYSSFRLDEFGTTFFTDAAEAGDWFFFAADKISDAVSCYRHLTGDVPMMPKWLFGYTQSKEHYHTQEEILSVLHEYRKRKIPLDLIVQDWNYWPENTWSDKCFDPSRYPDPKGMCEDIHKNHAHVMISVWPNTRGGHCFKELYEKDQLLTDDGTYGGGGVYNVFDDAACDTYWDQMNESIFRQGFDAWWGDATEPFEPGYGSFLEPDEQKSLSLSHFRRWFDSSRINVFSLLHSRNLYEHQRKETDRKRVVNLTRSGYAGQQRYSAIVWSGDIEGSFEELRRQAAEGLSYSVSGLPYWTLDIGGFYPVHGGAKFNTATPYHANTDPGYRELYTRWIQFGCFLPVFRSHGTNFPREVWCFGEPGELFYDSIRKFIDLRYRLMPYIYSTAWQVTKHRETFIRLLAFDFADDKEALAQGSDSYLFGHAFLISPVTKAMYYEGTDTPLDLPKEKNVYLPAGTTWYDFWTEESFAGGQYVKTPAPMDSMPIYVRSGSILPMTAPMQYVDEIPDAPYEITVYPGADGHFTVYEDSGDSYDYESGAYAEYDLCWNDAARTLTVSARRGTFEGMAETRTLLIRAVGGKTTEITYSGKAVTITL